MEFDIAGKLFPDLLTMIVQLSATGVLFYGFKRLLWKPMTAYIAKRAEIEDQALRQADEANKLAQVNLAHSELSVQNAVSETKTIIEQGKEEAKQIKDKLMADAKAEADAKLEAARREIEHQKTQLRKDIESEIIDVALIAAKKLMEDKVDEVHDRRQVQQIIKDVRN
jgi:F-type H+-transporting ATPase subunit b